MLTALLVTFLLVNSVGAHFYNCAGYNVLYCEILCEDMEAPGFTDNPKYVVHRVNCESCYGVFCKGYVFYATGFGLSG